MPPIAAPMALPRLNAICMQAAPSSSPPLEQCIIETCNGLETANNKIVTDEKRATNIPGVYAAGDCTPGLQQIAKAVCDGMIAGTEALKYLKSNA